MFQFFQLLPTLTVAENVMLPMDFAKLIPAGERRQRAVSVLERVGIADQADKLPSTLSGGQQQRAAIARALANDPWLLLADEPTDNLVSHMCHQRWIARGLECVLRRRMGIRPGPSGGSVSAPVGEPWSLGEAEVKPTGPQTLRKPVHPTRGTRPVRQP